MHLGFACTWDPDPRRTWSGTPWNLWQALSQDADVTDLGPHVGRLPRAALKTLYARRHDGRTVSVWKWSRTWEALAQRTIGRNAARHDCDAVLEIQDLAALDRPFFLYQDLSVDLLRDAQRAWGGAVPGFEGVSQRTIERRRERQHRMYDHAAGIFTMSRWLADDLVTSTGVAGDKVHVVAPGTNNTAVAGTERVAPPNGRRLLFVGRDFHRKGGDLVVDALAILRRDVDPSTTLTIAGPSAWSRPGSPPEGVTFAGSVPEAEVSRLYDTHDLFVMPSRFEAYGIVFVEALSRGLPCIARDACAMPEIIQPGVNGALVAGDEPQVLADAIAHTLDDESLRASCWEHRGRVAEHFSWARAAREITDGIRELLP